MAIAHENYKEMLPALALSALDAADARLMNQHLAECDECRRELADWENTAAALALTASPAEPSPQVRQQIMSAVRSENQPQQDSRLVQFPFAQRSFWTSFGWVGAIAAVVLVAVLIIWIVVIWQQNRVLQRDMDILATQMRSVQQDLDRSDRFVKLLSTPGAKLAQLYGTGPGSDARARLAYDRRGSAMLLAENLPPAPEGKAYQLWFIVGKNPPIPGKLFAPDDIGRGTLTDQVPGQAMDSAVFAVTLEPSGGVDAPTGAIYLRGSL